MIDATESRERALVRLKTLSLRAALRGDTERALEMARRYDNLRYYGMTTGPTVLDSRIPPESHMADLDLPGADADDPRTVRV